jgi:SpoVK/Ycf46/Vps4 family AAA+-type ATPase
MIPNDEAWSDDDAHPILDLLNVTCLLNLEKPLIELNKIIGMDRLKKDIVDLILYYIQDMHKYSIKSRKTGVIITHIKGDYLHTVLQGAPGVGKTMVAKILAKIYCALGCISTNQIIFAKKEDFVGSYVGHTENKTKALLEKARGGVLFIDEAYSFSGDKGTDSFAKIAIDMLNQHLSEEKDFVCIIAGYEKELKENFFSINPGLNSRFPWKFTLEEYTPKELYQIFEFKAREERWSVIIEDEEEILSFFNKHIKDFPFYGRDIEVFFSKCKIVHTRRIFGKKKSERKKITIEDVLNAFNLYLKHRDQKEDVPNNHIYI